MSRITTCGISARIIVPTVSSTVLQSVCVWCEMRTDDPTIQFKSFEELLEQDGYLVYTNGGYSMMPLLRERKDIIIIKKKGPERCKKYDVALYKRGETYILHRILKVLPDGYIIAGDHNSFVEKDIKDENILGVMTRVIRDGKSIYMDDWRYRLYVHLWVDFYPIRAAILHCKAGIRALIRRKAGKRQEKKTAETSDE